MEAADKKRYWNDQIKAMLGPCMITFAIPLTIPGLTITLVAFSEDTTFETYGVIHIVGILFLATAVILLILGCMLRMLWKPTIGPDIEMHLTPLQSVTSLRNHRKESQQMKINNIYSGARVGPEERVTRNTSRHQESHPKKGQTALSGQVAGHSSKQFEGTCNGTHQKENTQSRSGDTDHRRNSRDTIRKDRRLSRSSIVQDDSSIEETESESESVIIKKKRNRKSSADSLGRGESRHTNDSNVDERFPLDRSRSHKRSKQPSDEPCLDEIQQWRQKKKSKQKSKVVDTGIVNAASDCEDTTMSRPLPKLQLNERPLSSSNLENGSSTGEETNSGQSTRSPHQSLLQHDDSLEKKKRRKKKRASKPVRRHGSTDHSNDAKPTRVLPPVLRGRHQSQSDGEHHLNDVQRSGSTDSINSIGSADSVLAQYTSRSQDE
ncbi:uncharacterized protein LOC110456743 [Mizuhopecten yessoensis]|uniref:Uncharacterized protein n=1 Tax=Mizuhopecten yessoensis TaxID=6573 RepID=A0A210QA92_MIZYE|nr:uncharacterized protein LOC110456743 [Mizuhopecten yessoensis]OWF45652.1 hypothetical protein KP79_PYT05954 [Mizuhopecten yessoensis]